MAYSKQDFTTGQVLTAAQMDQIETNIADHEHGTAGISPVDPTEITTGGAGQVVHSDGSANSWTDKITLATEQSLSGTEVDFTSIPAWVKRITIMLESASTNGTTAIRIVLGDTDGFETASYAGLADGPTDANHSSAFFITTAHAAAGVYHGIATLHLKDSANNTWCLSSLTGRSDTTADATKAVGTKSLSGTLTQIRITADGVDTFDGGSVNIHYE